MQSDNFTDDLTKNAIASAPIQSVSTSKPPRLILESVYGFAPNRETLGGTAFFIVSRAGNLLIDTPAWNDVNRQFLLTHGVKYWFFTHRGGMGKTVAQMQEALNCQVVVQATEAYLLPGVETTAFDQQFILEEFELISTPGHSPGSSCVYTPSHGGILFTGRHLLPLSQTQIAPLKYAKTFHWWRQLNSVKKLRDRFTPETLRYICPGANTGLLRGKGYIDNAYQQIATLDLESLRQQVTDNR